MLRVWGLVVRQEAVGYRVQGAGCRVQSGGWRVEGGGWMVEGGGRRVQGAECRVQSAGCRVQGVVPGRPPLAPSWQPPPASGALRSPLPAFRERER